MISQGVVYCVTDCTAYLEAALISALTLRSLEPNLPITIVSNLPLLTRISLKSYDISTRSLTETELGGNHSFRSRALKTRLIQWSPYQETLFLDADILPCQPINALWKYLDQAPVGMVLDRLPTVEMCEHISTEEKMHTLAQVPAFSSQFNSGVLLWRNNAQTQQLFDQWHREWQIFKKHDQLALVRALHKTQVSVTALPKTYNVSPIDSVFLIEEGYTIHLLHCWGGMIASGEHRTIAQSYYPDIVQTVDRLVSAGCIY